MSEMTVRKRNIKKLLLEKYHDCLKGEKYMLNKITDKIKESIAKSEENRIEKERLEMEKLKQEKERLLSLDEKELLVELIFAVRKIEDEQKELAVKVENLDTTQGQILLNQNLKNY